MKKLYFLLFTFLITSFSFGQDMVITGVFDGPLTGGTPKAVEIYVINNISDLSTFGFGSANNGGGTDGEEFPFTGTANAGDFIYLTANEADFETYFGFAADFVDNSANNNGDDALELFSGGVVIDTFGDIATDGNGEPWEYLDGWAYRTSSTGPDGATFSLGNWSFSGINAVDGCTDNGSCSSSFPLGTFTYGGTPCGISLGTAVYACSTSTLGDNNDGVTVEIPYTGLDATITSVSTNSGGTVAGSNPALDTDGTITITGLFEGDAWDITINGGNCDGISISGTTPAAECDPIPDTCFNLSDGSNEFEIVTLATNVDGDVWTNSNGTYAINGFCGGGCSEETNGWLIFGPLDMQGASDLSLLFTASESFSGTDLNIQYTSDYSSLCPDSSTWTSAAVITDAGTYSVDLSAAIGNDVFVGIEYNDSDGSFSGWSLTNVELAAFGQCPTLGTIPTSACATCTINLQTENYVCLTNTAGDNNDGVTVEIPYTGSDTSGGTLSTTSLGVISGDISVADSTITITGLSEGDAWDLTINGGNCDTTTVSGTIPVAECDPSLTVNVGITGTVDGVYINEIHYDNTDADVGEFFEVAGPAGTDLSSYTVSLYNGSDDELYGSNDTFNLTGTIDDEGSGVGAIVVSLPSNGLQNGGPDGLSLSKTGSNDIQFLSYEGVIASAGDGPAIGLASVDIGVSENQADTPAGYSLEYDETTTSWIVVTDDTPGDFAQGTALSNGDFNLAKFSLFPNPTNSGYVNITSTNGGTINAKVFDILGKKVIDVSIENNRLDVNQLKTGIYIIKMTQGTNSTTKKLVIE